MESLNLIKNDPWLAPYEAAIEGRYQYVIDKEKSLTNNGKLTLSEMASGYLYFARSDPYQQQSGQSLP